MNYNETNYHPETFHQMCSYMGKKGSVFLCSIKIRKKRYFTTPIYIPFEGYYSGWLERFKTGDCSSENISAVMNHELRHKQDLLVFCAFSKQLFSRYLVSSIDWG
ncbi:hypothetical protein CDAR_494061 [Caerostris darwini]|uniref:Uncharacterized protein n=1 Tax=Caerostris darwini TaxID=1538125 RepID=A0AAV4MRA8_9ARAC|nr:hypothetical protein CDAR_494061 [Caerostris darwini]